MNTNDRCRSRKGSRAFGTKARIVLAIAAMVALATTEYSASAVHHTAPSGTLASQGEAGCVPAVIDDFTTGAYRSPDLNVGSADATISGSMLGGRRASRIVSRPNRYEMPTTFLVPLDGKSPLIVSSGYQGFSVLTIQYGLLKPGQVAPLNADLSCHSLFRLRFASIDLPLNVNMEVKSASSPSVYQCGFNTPANRLNGFTLDFKFGCFVTNDPAHPPVDWTDIDRILLQIQPASQVGANDYAISSLKLAGSAPAVRLDGTEGR